MKLFTVNVKKYEYDDVCSVAVLAKNKERAIELAIQYNNIFEDNIENIEELNIKNEGVVHDHVLYG